MNDEPLNPNPFSKPVISTRPNKDKNSLFRAIGFTLHTWEQTEAAIGLLYVTIAAPSHDRIVDNVILSSLSAVNAPNSKRIMIELAADAYFHQNPAPELYDRLSRILKLYKSASVRRNEIAHGMALEQVTIDIVYNTVDEAYYLAPSYLSATKREISGKAKYQYGSRDLLEMARNYKLLGNQITRLRNDIESHWIATHPKSE